MPTYSFPDTPAYLPVHLRSNWNAPLQLSRLLGGIHSFGNMLNARLSSMPDRSTSELLRTL